jgi:hypothetical protein
MKKSLVVTPSWKNPFSEVRSSHARALQTAPEKNGAEKKLRKGKTKARRKKKIFGPESVLENEAASYPFALL